MLLFTVVENAGYLDECEVNSFSSLAAAYRFIKRTYPDDVAENLHVAIRKDGPDYTTYEL